MKAGIATLAAIVLLALLAPVLAPQTPGDQFADRAFAPPMRIHLRDAAGWRAPFVYPQHVASRLDRLYSSDASSPATLRWFEGGRLLSLAPAEGPLLLLGADGLGRDVFSRLLYGARLSIGVTVLGALTALLIGTFIGGIAGAAGGRVDALLMMIADFGLVLPGLYLVLVLRTLLPQTITTTQVFWLMVVIFGIAGWPHVARGVRGIVASERTAEYAEAARAAGAGRLRMMRHLLPAARGFLAVQLVLLIPSLFLAEAVVSFLGLGFPEPTASWGTMLQEASNVSAVVGAPWTLAPAAALFVVVWSVMLAGSGKWPENILLLSDRRGSRSRVKESV